MSEWISVKDRLPESGHDGDTVPVIVCVKSEYGYTCGMGFYWEKKKTWFGPAMVPLEDENWKVTHWMPLPEPPEVE